MLTLKAICEEFSGVACGRHRAVEGAVAIWVLLIWLFLAQVQTSDRASMAALPTKTSLHAALSFNGTLLFQCPLSGGRVCLRLCYGIGECRVGSIHARSFVGAVDVEGVILNAGAVRQDRTLDRCALGMLDSSRSTWPSRAQIGLRLLARMLRAAGKRGISRVRHVAVYTLSRGDGSA